MNSLSGKIGIVTGSSRGIGAAIAIRLASHGATVFLHYAHSKEKALQVQQNIKDKGGEAKLVQADFLEADEIDIFFNQIDEILEGRKLDILVNNAAIPHPADNTEITEEQFDQLVQVNFKAPFFISRRAVERMNDGGRIINISSRASQKPTHRSGVYGMTKAALDNLTIQMASLLGARKITVNSVMPGPILTDMNRHQFEDEEIRQNVANRAAMKKIGHPEDVAKVVAFLASSGADWITGDWVDVSGGLGI